MGGEDPDIELTVVITTGIVTSLSRTTFQLQKINSIVPETGHPFGIISGCKG